MTMHVRVGGVWKIIAPASVNVGGTWKTITQGWVNVGGTWKQFYSTAAPTLAGLGNQVADGFGAQLTVAGFRFNANGTLDVRAGLSPTSYSAAPTPWLASGPFTGYDVRVTVTAGLALTLGTTGSWLPLSTDRPFELGRNTQGLSQSTMTVEIRKDAGPALVSKSIQLTAFNDVPGGN